MVHIYDALVIGAGPAGMAAALEIEKLGGSVLLLEREGRAGGILKQCIHDGFGLSKFKKQLTGPEYAQIYLDRLETSKIKLMLKSFVTSIEKNEDLYKSVVVNRDEGLLTIYSKTVVLATGCRERTSKQVFINGERPAGVYTAGTAQYLVNIDGVLPCHKCLILGSGDIGLIMARRLTLEGSEVVGVYEAKSTPSGLKRNIQQCLDDFNIPLYLSKTVTRLVGVKRLEGVYVADLNEEGLILEQTETFVACDGLILSVGLIPENEVSEKLGILMDEKTKGPKVDENKMTSASGVFCCGNAEHVYDLVDFVSISGEKAGQSVMNFIRK